MKRKDIDSSLLHSVGFDESDSVLEIQFNHGAVYRYFDVPKSVYLNLLKVESSGNYFNNNIRDDFDYIRVS